MHEYCFYLAIKLLILFSILQYHFKYTYFIRSGMVIKAIIAGIGCLLIYATNSAFIYDISVLRKWIPNKSSYHYFIGLSDFHDRTAPENAQQREHVLELLRQCNPEATKIIIEDLSSQNDQGDFGCQNFLLQSKVGLLAGMAYACKSYGLDVNNIEYRYCRVISLAPILHTTNKNALGNSGMNYDITIDALHNEVYKAMHTIKAQCLHDSSLRTLAKKTINLVKRELKEFKLEQSMCKPVVNYVTDCAASGSGKLVLIKKMLTFDSCLIDIKLLEAVLASQNKKKSIAIAGGTHIDHVKELLVALGYEVVHHMSPSFIKEYNLARCHVGSRIIDGSFCIKPRPIALDKIDFLLP
jgi:hypothetical protein